MAITSMDPVQCQSGELNNVNPYSLNSGEESNQLLTNLHNINPWFTVVTREQHPKLVTLACTTSSLKFWQSSSRPILIYSHTRMNETNKASHLKSLFPTMENCCFPNSLIMDGYQYLHIQTPTHIPLDIYLENSRAQLLDICFKHLKLLGQNTADATTTGKLLSTLEWHLK